MRPGDDAALAAHLAGRAGDVLVDLRRSGLSGRSLAVEGDRRAQQMLADGLREARPADPVLSEEAADGPERLVASRVWIIDPLDGTREYAEGRDDWAVHVALWVEGDLVAGAVAMPARGLVLRSDRPAAVPDPDGRAPRIAVSRTRPPDVAVAVAEAVGGELVPLGSAGYKTCSVVLGEVDAYVHAGGQYEWDSAAPAVVARAAGLHVSRIDGSPLRYNQPEPWLPDLLVARESLATTVLGLVRAST